VELTGKWRCFVIASCPVREPVAAQFVTDMKRRMNALAHQVSDVIVTGFSNYRRTRLVAATYRRVIDD